MKVIFAIVLFFLGASVFSFLNVVIFRVPRGEEFVKTRSHCPGCGRVLTPLDLVPVLSYLCLGGKCRTCGSKIGVRDVLIEISGGCMCIIAFFRSFMEPVGSIAEKVTGDFYARLLAGLFVFLFLCVMTVIHYICYDTAKIPNGTLIAATIIGICGIFVTSGETWMSRCIGCLGIAIPFVIFAVITKEKEHYALALLLGLSGCMLGKERILVLAAVTILTGAIIFIVRKLLGKKGKFHLMTAVYPAMIIVFLLGDLLLEYFVL